MHGALSSRIAIGLPILSSSPNSVNNSKCNHSSSCTTRVSALNSDLAGDKLTVVSNFDLDMITPPL